MSIEQLTNNYLAHWSRITENRDNSLPDFTDRFMRLEVTHTFSESAYNNIFLNPDAQHRGLLSYEYRRSHGLTTSRPPTEPAASFGLNRFVFAYLGSHEPYYAGQDTDPAFGVFISRNLEYLETSNASRRDLASPEIREPIQDEFMMPEDARKIIALEIENNHQGDIWSYWGNPNGDLKKMWESKAEMHFLDKIQISDIKGILWPVKINTYSANGRDYSQHTREQQEFAELYPHIKIYNYTWKSNFNYGSKSFINASCCVSKHYFSNNDYPPSQMYLYENTRK
ncbi:MAG: hypothetical protein LBD53_02365 [Tannerella sp.]|jgi:hypothetical protein|nr:hypothetical protein [Tannerella sp.]